jgi:hypothetical protein
VDPEIIRNTRWNLDVAGHYSRPDAFQLTVRTTPNPIIRVDTDSSSSPVDELKEEIFFSKEIIDQK